MTERNIVREKEHILGDGKVSSVLKEKPVLLSGLVWAWRLNYTLHYKIPMTHLAINPYTANKKLAHSLQVVDSNVKY